MYPASVFKSISAWSDWSGLAGIIFAKNEEVSIVIFVEGETLSGLVAKGATFSGLVDEGTEIDGTSEAV